MIYTAGPDLTGNEKKYINDCIDRWKNGQHRYYNDLFEDKLSEYVGAKYVRGTNSGTGALHLACMAAGLGEGDEVITPEISYIASANAIEYTGAKPVFCDVAEDTWCIDDNKIEDLIRGNTKAILPVYKYGNMPNMQRIMEIAREYDLLVIADACPALGAEQKVDTEWRKAGAIADIACFSFQGAKTAVMGEGGAVCTNDRGLWEKINFYNNNCEVEGRKFYHYGVGHCYDLSPICAAMGVAQIERIDDFVDRKREFATLYRRYLHNDIVMQKERQGTRSTFWMNSILTPQNGYYDVIDRSRFMSYLAENDIDTRPVFYPISTFKHYETMDSPVAQRIGRHGVNLPSGLMLQEKDIKYISEKTNAYFEGQN